MDVIQIKDKQFKTFIPEADILKEVERVASEINRDLADANPLFISVLNGSFMFTADLMKRLTIPCEISFVKLASYEGMSSSGKIKRTGRAGRGHRRAYSGNRGGYCRHGLDDAAPAGNAPRAESEGNPDSHAAGEARQAEGGFGYSLRGDAYPERFYRRIRVRL